MPTEGWVRRVVPGRAKEGGGPELEGESAPAGATLDWNTTRGRSGESAGWLPSWSRVKTPPDRRSKTLTVPWLWKATELPSALMEGSAAGRGLTTTALPPRTHAHTPASVAS